MIREEVVPSRIRDLLAACDKQQGMLRRIIVEAEPGFQDSRLKVLLAGDTWPAAINEHLIAGTERDLAARADSILDNLVGVPISGKRLLDFGCGDGRLVGKARRRGAIALGYDVDPIPGDDLTSDWREVIDRGPYDMIVAYDVLDHSVEDPIECLKKIRSSLAPGGTAFIRCHPWCSRTGNHSYRSLNKAFLHYFFSDEQLAEMGCPGIYTRRVVHPIAVYNDWVSKSGLIKISEDVHRNAIEPIWQEEPILRSLVHSHWKSSYEDSLADGTKFPTYQMEIGWVDFRLSP